MTVAAGAGVWMLLVGCGGSEEGTQATSSPAPPTTASAEPSESVSELEGTWQTSVVSQSDAEAALRRYGLAEWIKEFRPLAPFPDDTVLTLDIHEGEWNLYGEPKGGARQEIDYDAEYVVNGNEVKKIHATGETTYRWSVQGDTLTLEWLKSTEPPFEGVPDEVFGTALYMTTDFERQG
jgi:hypothetical protein